MSKHIHNTHIPDDKCLHLIKRLIRQKDLRVRDWKNISEDDLLTKTNCIDIARAIIWKITNINVDCNCDFSDVKNNTETELVIDHKTLFRGKDPIFNKLFNVKGNEHFLCWFEFEGHAMIIEIKKSDKRSWARAYMSFFNLFTLEDWLDNPSNSGSSINPFKRDICGWQTLNFYKDLHRLFGNGKRVSIPSLSYLITEINRYHTSLYNRNSTEYRHPKDSNYYIRIFQLDRILQPSTIKTKAQYPLDLISYVRNIGIIIYFCIIMLLSLFILR